MFGLRTQDGRLTAAPDELTARKWLEYNYSQGTIGEAGERLVNHDGESWKLTNEGDLNEYRNH